MILVYTLFKKKKKKENPWSNLGLPRVIMRGQINPLIRVSNVARKISCTSNMGYKGTTMEY